MKVIQGRPLKGWRRRKHIDRIIIHESVTWSAEATVAVLSRRGLSVHYIVAKDGTITRHVEDDRKAAHAGRWHNDRSLGLEVVNRYYGHRAKGEATITARWAHRRSYILPPMAQLEQLWTLTLALCTEHGIPVAVPAARKGRFKWGRLSRYRRTRPGIHAHHEWAHADGLFPLHYCWLRSLGVDPLVAYATTITAASSGKRVTDQTEGIA